MGETKVSLAALHQECTKNVERLHSYYGGAEQIIQNYSTFQNFKSSTSLTESQLTDLNNKLNGLKQNLVQVSDVIAQDQKRLVFTLKSYISHVNEALQALIHGDLNQWLLSQKMATFGVNQNPGTVELSKSFQSLMDHAFFIWKHIEKFAKLDRRLTKANIHRWDASSEAQKLDQLRYNLVYQLLQWSFIVSKQPPLVLKNREDVAVRILAAKREFGLETLPARVSCQIINQETAEQIVLQNYVPENFPKVGTVDQKPKDLEYFENDRVFGIEFKRAKITVGSRRAQGNGNDAIRRKYYLLFKTEISLHTEGGAKLFSLWTLSLPFVVSVHGTQDMELWATILWDIAFSDESSKQVPLKGKSSVSWSRVAQALQGVFGMISGCKRGLNDEDLVYLKRRFFPPAVLQHSQNPAVTWAAFFEDRLQGNIGMCCPFSFWQWFFHIADMLYEKAGHRTGVKDLWEANLIYGFVKRDDCRDKLLSVEDASLIIRFSDNQLGALSVSYRIPDTSEVEHLRPFRQKDLIEKLGLPKIIESLEQLVEVDKVYPNQDKAQILQLVRKPRSTVTEAAYVGYELYKLTLEPDGARKNSLSRHRPSSTVSAIVPTGTPSLAASPAPSIVSLPPSATFSQQGFEPMHSDVFDVDTPTFEEAPIVNGFLTQLNSLDSTSLTNYLEILEQMEADTLGEFQGIEPTEANLIGESDMETLNDYFPNMQLLMN